MRSIFLLIAAALLFSACSSQELMLTNINQQPCRNEAELNNSSEFVGETAENLMVYQQGEQVFASMDVRTYCSARISFDVVEKDDNIWLKLRNNNTMTDDCVCIMNVTASVAGLSDGTYQVMVTNSTGETLLAQQTIVVTD